MTFAVKEPKWKCSFKAEVTLEAYTLVQKHVGCSNINVLNDFMWVFEIVNEWNVSSLILQINFIV